MRDVAQTWRDRPKSNEDVAGSTSSVWRLIRTPTHLRHLITLLDELAALGVAFVSLRGIDDARRQAQMHILGAIAEFERERIERGCWRV